MEPMTLGSPISCPSSPTAGPSFLPGYLMGDPVSGTGSRVYSLSPTKLNRSTSAITSPQTPLTPQPQKGLLTPHTPLSQQNRSIGLRARADKHGGPPVQGLFHQFSTPTNTSISQQFSTPVPSTPQLSFGATPSHTPHITRNSLSVYSPNVSQQKDASYAILDSTGESNAAVSNTWVTVFGFPPAAASFILAQLSNYGTILEKRMANNGNWMHLHYQTKLQANKVLSKNGKVFGGSIMLGVVPCTDKEVMMECQKENISVQDSATDSFVNTSILDKSKGGNIRPLTQAYKAAQAEHEVIPDGHTPTKSNSVVSKAMEYIFGW